MHCIILDSHRGEHGRVNQWIQNKVIKKKEIISNDREFNKNTQEYVFNEKILRRHKRLK